MSPWPIGLRIDMPMQTDSRAPTEVAEDYRWLSRRVSVGGGAPQHSAAAGRRRRGEARHRRRRSDQSGGRAWSWLLVAAATAVIALSVVTGWGPGLMGASAVAAAAFGFRVRRGCWWGLPTSVAGAALLLCTLTSQRLVTDVVVVALCFLGVGGLGALARRGLRRDPVTGRLAPFTAAVRRAGWRVLVVPPASVAVVVVVALLGALVTPGNQGLEAKWADWFRAHHLTAAANDLENIYYTHTAPTRGGRPAHLNAVPGRAAPAAARPRTTPAAAANGHLAPPRPVPLVVSPALPGEGQWFPTGPVVDGAPAMYVAQFRADNLYTSQITSAVWIDPTRLRLSLVPGAQEPGGTWPQPANISASALPTTFAAFNGGFRMKDAHGGFYLDGRTAVPLQPGAASVVIYRDGHVNIGSWGSEVSMTPDVEAVLQNLVPLVDNGQTAPSATYNDAGVWGHSINPTTVVARSGIGVTARGALVYVAGPALTARSLAESLQRAGAVRAMTLDINPTWVTFNFYVHEPNGQIVPAKLYPAMKRPADRYLGPTQESRDFFTLSTPAS